MRRLKECNKEWDSQVRLMVFSARLQDCYHVAAYVHCYNQNYFNKICDSCCHEDKLAHKRPNTLN